MALKEISKTELKIFLYKLGIKEEGIQAILATFPLGEQRLRLKQLITHRIEEGMTAKEAVRLTWQRQHGVQMRWMKPVGDEPTEEDFLKL